MALLSPAQYASREKTLVAALLLSMWAPLATGIAVMMSSSVTQLADFIRRSVELIALFVSWRVFRYLHRHRDLSEARKDWLEKAAGLSVSIALIFSGLVMLLFIFLRAPVIEPGGNVYPGLAIAFLGLITNSWFWRRYASLNKEEYSAIINAQRQLYRAKAFVDLCVIIALSSVALIPHHFATFYIDLLGSIVLAGYLLWSGVRAGYSAYMPFKKKIKPLERQASSFYSRR